MVVWNSIKKIITIVCVKNDDFFKTCFIEVELFEVERETKVIKGLLLSSGILCLTYH